MGYFDDKNLLMNDIATSDATSETKEKENNEEVTNLGNCKLEDYLKSPKTPQRTGKRQSERMPYVVTSSTYKKILEDKQKLKEETERKKEEKRIERQKRKQEQLEKKAQQNTKRGKTQRILKTINKNKQERNNKDVVSKEQNQCKDAHVRNLFLEEGLCADVKTAETEKPILVKNNILVRRGLCFICTNNIYLTRVAIRCQKCNRTYHVDCLERKNMFKDFFECQSCSSIQ